MYSWHGPVGYDDSDKNCQCETPDLDGCELCGTKFCGERFEINDGMTGCGKQQYRCNNCGRLRK